MYITDLRFEILTELYKHKNALLPLKKLDTTKLQVLPKLGELGLINYDSTHVWMTLEGYTFLLDEATKRIIRGLKKYGNEMNYGTLSRIIDTTLMIDEPDQDIHSFWIQVLEGRGLLRKTDRGTWIIVEPKTHGNLYILSSPTGRFPHSR